MRILDLVLCVNYPSFEKGQPVFRETLVLRGNPFLGPTAPGSHFDQVVIAAFVPRVAQDRAGRKKKTKVPRHPPTAFWRHFCWFHQQTKPRAVLIVVDMSKKIGLFLQHD